MSTGGGLATLRHQPPENRVLPKPTWVVGAGISGWTLLGQQLQTGMLGSLRLTSQLFPFLPLQKERPCALGTPLGRQAGRQVPVLGSKRPSAPHPSSHCSVSVPGTSLLPTTSASSRTSGGASSRSSAPPYCSSLIPAPAAQKTRRTRRTSRRQKAARAPWKVSQVGA